MPWRPLPRDPGDEPPRPVADSLGPLAASLGAPPPEVLSSLFARWADVVGAEVAAHCRPASLRHGELLLDVDHPAWAAQLGYLKGDLLARVQVAGGSETVTSVRLRVRSPRRR